MYSKYAQLEHPYLLAWNEETNIKYDRLCYHLICLLSEYKIKYPLLFILLETNWAYNVRKFHFYLIYYCIEQEQKDSIKSYFVKYFFANTKTKPLLQMYENILEMTCTQIRCRFLVPIYIAFAEKISQWQIIHNPRGRKLSY